MAPNTQPVMDLNEAELATAVDLIQEKHVHLVENDSSEDDAEISAGITGRTLNSVEVTASNSLQLLSCAAQEYAWGRVGSSSMVARMKANAAKDCTSDGFQINEETPYAELWVGTHPSGMSTMCTSEGCMTLRDYVKQDPALHCGSTKVDDLTFLFKVLSINKVLSIQAHPDKKLAEKLHAERPNVYKDGNHKPEMVFALTDDVEGMCGFRPMKDICDNLREYPEFAVLVGHDAKEAMMKTENGPADNKPVMQQMFRSYLEASDEVVQSQLENLLTRISSKEQPTETELLMIKLSKQFPGDSGIMAPLLLNHVKLVSGQSFFIGANEPHAYINGEILECMACSDNVVRAGLTPKLKDVDTLVSMLTYDSQFPQITNGRKLDDCTTVFAPPVEDFAIEVVDVPPNSSYVLQGVASPSVLLTVSGTARLQQGDVQCLDVEFGTTAFASANTKATVLAGRDGVRIARAMSNVYFADES